MNDKKNKLELKDSLGWRKLSEERTFWQRLKADLREANSLPASAFDTVFLWACLVSVATILIVVVRVMK